LLLVLVLVLVLVLLVLVLVLVLMLVLVLVLVLVLLLVLLLLLLLLLPLQTARLEQKLRLRHGVLLEVAPQGVEQVVVSRSAPRGRRPGLPLGKTVRLLTIRRRLL
jgi:hypothetical protein